MAYPNESDIFFDDMITLKTVFGEGYLNVNAVNANCDCISYTPTFDNEDFDTQKSPGVATATR